MKLHNRSMKNIWVLMVVKKKKLSTFNVQYSDHNLDGNEMVGFKIFEMYWNVLNKSILYVSRWKYGILNWK